MFRLMTVAAVIATILVAASCSREPEPLPPRHVEESPTSDERPREPVVKADLEGVLPNDWYVDTNDENSTMLLNFIADEDIWIVIELNRTVPDHDVQRARDYYRGEIEDSTDSKYEEGGTVETTSLGTAAWSLVNFDEEDVTTDEISLFVRHPARQAIVVLKFLSPSSYSDIQSKLNELIEIAEVIAPSI